MSQGFRRSTKQHKENLLTFSEALRIPRGSAIHSAVHLIHCINMFSQRVLKSSAPLVGTALIGGGFLAASIYNASSAQFPPQPTADHTTQHSSGPKDPRKIFTSGFSFQDLKLESSEVVNHNTKRLRFEFPDKDAVSGLRASCMFFQPKIHFPCRLLRLGSCAPNEGHSSRCLAARLTAVYPDQ